MKNLSAAKSIPQCFICRGWSHLVSKSHGGVQLCLPCYVDVLEVRERRGADPEPNVGVLREGPDQEEPYRQGELFGPPRA